MEYMIAHYSVREFTTTYVWGNEHAKRLYESAGFVETDVEPCGHAGGLYLPHDHPSGSFIDQCADDGAGYNSSQRIWNPEWSGD